MRPGMRPGLRCGGRSLAWLCVVVMAAAGCGTATGGAHSAGRVAATAGPSADGSSGTGSAGPTTTPTPSQAPGQAPSAAGRQVAVDGVTFRVPRGWFSVDASVVARPEAAQQPEVKRLAGQLGVSPAQVVRLFAQVDLYAFSSSGAHRGFLDNLNVLATPAAGLPDRDTVRLQLARVGARVGSFSTRDSAAGPVLVADYSLPTGSGVTVFGRSLILLVDGQVVDISVSASDDRSRVAHGELVLASLAAGAA